MLTCFLSSFLSPLDLPGAGTAGGFAASFSFLPAAAGAAGAAGGPAAAGGFHSAPVAAFHSVFSANNSATAAFMATASAFATFSWRIWSPTAAIFAFNSADMVHSYMSRQEVSFKVTTLVVYKRVFVCFSRELDFFDSQIVEGSPSIFVGLSFPTQSKDIAILWPQIKVNLHSTSCFLSRKCLRHSGGNKICLLS